MIRFIVFLLAVVGLAFLFAWVADNPGTVYLQWDWLASQMGRPGEEVGIPLNLALTLIVALIVLVLFVSAILRGVFGMPTLLSKFFENRRREKGYKALSQGLIAASSGDADTARSLTKESGRLLGEDPLVALLGTQTALLEGKRDEARQNFQKMLADDDTRMVALRGLFLEAERQGEPEAARHYAEEAVREAPSLPWAGNAKLRYQAADGDWDAAVQTLEANRSAGLIDKVAAKRQRAVLLTAKAMSVEQANPESARKLAKEAHRLAKDLVPAATTYARTASRMGDISGASKVIEAAWKVSPHPELAEAYATVRAGDSVQDRMKRAKRLAGLKSNHVEGNLAIAIAAIDAQDWDAARKALEPVLTSKPTERACLLMADIEEGQNGDKGRMREWLSRAVRAPADEAWTADGQVSEEWMPLSPVSGEIDAFEWKVPVEQLGTDTLPVLTLEELRAEAVPVATKETELEQEKVIDTPAKDDDIVEAEVVEETAEKSLSDQKPEEVDKPENDVAEGKPAVEEEKSNVVQLQTASTREDSGTEEAADAESTKSEVGEGNVAADASEPRAGEKNTKADDEFPFERRPDDPGVHPDKQPPKKGFKLF